MRLCVLCVCCLCGFIFQTSWLIQVLSVLPTHPHIVTMYGSFTARVFAHTLPNIAQFPACLDAVRTANVQRVTEVLDSLGPMVSQLLECQAAMARVRADKMEQYIHVQCSFFDYHPCSLEGKVFSGKPLLKVADQLLAAVDHLITHGTSSLNI